MPLTKPSSAKRRLTLAASLLPALALGACSDYLQHSNTIASSAGDAQAHNRIVQTVDPWPRAAANTRIGGYGPRVDRVTKRYINGNGGAPVAPTGGVAAAPAPDQPPGPGGQPGPNGQPGPSGAQPPQ